MYIQSFCRRIGRKIRIKYLERSLETAWIFAILLSETKKSFGEVAREAERTHARRATNPYFDSNRFSLFFTLQLSRTGKLRKQCSEMFFCKIEAKKENFST